MPVVALKVIGRIIEDCLQKIVYIPNMTISIIFCIAGIFVFPYTVHNESSSFFLLQIIFHPRELCILDSGLSTLDTRIRQAKSSILMAPLWTLACVRSTDGD